MDIKFWTCQSTFKESSHPEQLQLLKSHPIILKYCPLIIPQYYAKMLLWPIIPKIMLAYYRLSPNGMHAELIDSLLALINAAPCILYIITSCIYRTSSKYSAWKTKIACLSFAEFLEVNTQHSICVCILCNFSICSIIILLYAWRPFPNY